MIQGSEYPTLPSGKPEMWPLNPQLAVMCAGGGVNERIKLASPGENWTGGCQGRPGCPFTRLSLGSQMGTPEGALGTVARELARAPALRRLAAAFS